MRSNLTCNGYKNPQGCVKALRSIFPRPKLLSIDFDEHETIALDFFRRVTVQQLPCASAFETPWESITLHLTTQQPAVAAAACACAAIHRAITGDEDYERYAYALQQYNKSLALLSRHIGNISKQARDEDIVIVLTVCLLYFTIEVFSGNDARSRGAHVCSDFLLLRIDLERDMARRGRVLYRPI